MTKCAHIKIGYQCAVSGPDFWVCLECGKRFIPDNRDFIDACAAQQSAIQAQADEYKQARYPAFPTHPDNCIDVIHGHFTRGESGITIRDYFAAKALQGFCANPAIFAANAMNGWHLVNCKEPELCDYAYHLADQMIHESSDNLPD